MCLLHGHASSKVGMYHLACIIWHILYGIYHVAYIIWHILYGMYHLACIIICILLNFPPTTIIFIHQYALPIPTTPLSQMTKYWITVCTFLSSLIKAIQYKLPHHDIIWNAQWAFKPNQTVWKSFRFKKEEKKLEKKGKTHFFWRRSIFCYFFLFPFPKLFLMYIILTLCPQHILEKKHICGIRILFLKFYFCPCCFLFLACCHVFDPKAWMFCRPTL